MFLQNLIWCISWFKTFSLLVHRNDDLIDNESGDSFRVEACKEESVETVESVDYIKDDAATAVMEDGNKKLNETNDFAEDSDNAVADEDLDKAAVEGLSNANEQGKVDQTYVISKNKMYFDK